MGEKEEECLQSSGGKTEGTRHLGRPWCKQEDNIRLNPTEIRLRNVVSIRQAQDRGQWQALVNTLLNH
jgi:hypothetical protein